MSKEQDTLKKPEQVTDRNKLVGREEELREVENARLRIEQISPPDQSPPVCILNFWGLPGIGKSTLGEMIEKKYKEQQISCVYLDLAGESPSSLPSAEEARILILDDVPITKPKDTTPIEPFLAEIVEKGKQVVVLLSQRRLNFSQFLVIRRAEAKELPPLSPEETAQQLAILSGGEIERKIADIIHFLITGGHPLANREVYNFIQTYQLTTGKEFFQGLISVLEKVTDTILDTVITQEMAKEAVTTRERLREAAKILAIPRVLDWDIAVRLLEEEEEYKGTGRAAALCEIFAALARANLIVWDKERKHYKPNPASRLLLNFSFLLTDPARYQKFCQKAKKNS